MKRGDECIVYNPRTRTANKTKVFSVGQKHVKVHSPNHILFNRNTSLDEHTGLVLITGDAMKDCEKYVSENQEKRVLAKIIAAADLMTLKESTLLKIVKLITDE